MAVDDHPIFLEGILSLLQLDPDLRLVTTASNGAEAIRRYRECLPDVTLMDVRMGTMDGRDATESIIGEFPGARIIWLTMYEGSYIASRAMAAGAYGFLSKHMVRYDLPDIVRRVHAGHRIYAPSDRNPHEQSWADNLTAREVEVLRLVAKGCSNKRAASILSISEHTVSGHMKSLMPKLGASDRTHAVVLAMKHGILSV